MTKKKAFAILVTVAILYIVISFFYSKFNSLSLNDKTTLDTISNIHIVKKSGKQYTYHTNNFPMLDRGDTVYATIPLPKEKYIPNSTLCFNIYNTTVDLSYKGRTFYEYGENRADNNQLIGNLFIQSILPEEAWGNFILLTCHIQEDGSFAKFPDFWIYSALQSAKAPLHERELDFFVYITIFTISLVIVVLLPFFNISIRFKIKGVLLCLFSLNLSVWYLCYTGMIYSFINDMAICSNLEYPALFIAPIFFGLYLYQEDLSSKSRIIALILSGLLTILCLTATIFNFTSTYHYTFFIRYVHIIMCVGIILLLFILIKSNEQYSLSKAVINYGICLSLLLIGFEIFSYYFSKYGPFNISEFSKNITSAGILTFIVSVVMNYSINLQTHYISKQEKKTLKKLAYIDQLTNIPNRASCSTYLNNLENCANYTIFFFDLNSLKLANDVYGHETGDALIRYVASSIKDVFEEEGFCARYGGDEFIAGLYHSNKSEIADRIKQFDKKIHKANLQKLFPFEVSVSYGYAQSTKKQPLSPETALKEADTKMYDSKMQFKKNHPELCRK